WNAVDARMPGDDLLRLVRLTLIEMCFVEQAVQEPPRVVGLAMIFGKNFVDFFGRSAGILAESSRASGPRRQFRHKLSDLRDRRFIILHSIMGHTGNFIMRARSAERFVVD